MLAFPQNQLSFYTEKSSAALPSSSTDLFLHGLHNTEHPQQVGKLRHGASWDVLNAPLREPESPVTVLPNKPGRIYTSPLSFLVVAYFRILLKLSNSPQRHYNFYSVQRIYKLFEAVVWSLLSSDG